MADPRSGTASPPSRDPRSASSTRGCGGCCCTTTTTRRRSSSSGCSRRSFNKPHGEAFAIMMHVHQSGLGVAGVYTHDVAETKVKATRAAGRAARVSAAGDDGARTGGAARMSRTPVPFAPETLESIQRAFRLAADRRHDLVGLEHLLLALIEDPQARAGPERAAASTSTRSRTDLDEVLERAFTPVPGPQGRRSPSRRSASIASSSRPSCTPPRRARSRSTAAACSCSCCRRRTATPRTSCASRASIG